MKQNYRDDVKEIVEDGIVQKTFIKVTPADAPLKEIFWFLRHLVEGWFATSVWSMLKTKKNFSASGICVEIRFIAPDAVCGPKAIWLEPLRISTEDMRAIEGK